MRKIIKMLAVKFYWNVVRDSNNNLLWGMYKIMYRLSNNQAVLINPWKLGK